MFGHLSECEHEEYWGQMSNYVPVAVLLEPSVYNSEYDQKFVSGVETWHVPLITFGYSFVAKYHIW